MGTQPPGFTDGLVWILTKPVEGSSELRNFMQFGTDAEVLSEYDVDIRVTRGLRFKPAIGEY